MTRNAEPSARHVVVFDCNVYLDAAKVTGEPFTWENFTQQAVNHAASLVPCGENPAVDSLRALAVSTSGKFAGDELLEVWTSEHIRATVVYKAMQPREPDPSTGYCGLGWNRQAAELLASDLLDELVVRSGGGDTGPQFPDGNPPLDHEDGLVFGACRYLAGEDPLCTVYCVTRDKGFINAHKRGRLPGHTKVLSPAIFLTLVRAARAYYAMPHPPL